MSNSFRTHLREQLAKPEFMAEFVNNAIEEGDSDTLKMALREVVNLKGAEAIAKRCKISRQSLSRMLSASGNPSYSNLSNIVKALGLKLQVAINVKPLPKNKKEINF